MGILEGMLRGSAAEGWEGAEGRDRRELFGLVAGLALTPSRSRGSFTTLLRTGSDDLYRWIECCWLEHVPYGRSGGSITARGTDD